MAHGSIFLVDRVDSGEHCCNIHLLLHAWVLQAVASRGGVGRQQ